MGLRDALRRLRREAKGEFVEIPQPDGSVARFPRSDLQVAFLRECDRLKGADLDPHPLTLAASRSTDPTWSRSGFAEWHVDGPVEDLSE
jgi:hypothetical protein